MLNRVERRLAYMSTPVAHNKRIAIRGCACNATNGNATASPGHILNEDCLAQGLFHRLRQDPRKAVCWPASCERHDNRDWPRRIGLRHNNGAVSQNNGTCQTNLHELHGWAFAQAERGVL